MNELGKDNYTSPLVSKNEITGEQKCDGEIIKFQPCTRNPNKCCKRGGVSNVGGYLCTLTKECKGRIVICGRSALVRKRKNKL